MKQTISIQSFDPIQFQSMMMTQVSSINTQYLGISVSVILGAGILLSILLYFLNFKPMLKKLYKQENLILKLSDDLEKERKLNEERFTELLKKEEEKINDLVKKIEITEKESSLSLEKIKNEQKNLHQELKEKVQLIDALGDWNKHYMWEFSKISVPGNTLSCLSSCLHKSLNYKITWLVDMSMDKIEDFIRITDPKQLKEEEILKEIESSLVRIEDNKSFNLVEKIKISIEKIRNS